jgi:hydrogen peroxide-dependent heme synthase
MTYLYRSAQLSVFCVQYQAAGFNLRGKFAPHPATTPEEVFMSTVQHPRPQVAADIPAVPLTTEGYSVLHQMMRFRRSVWRELPPAERSAIAKEAADVISEMEKNPGGKSALYSLIGHKGDLMLIHFRNSFADLNQAELTLANLRLNDYLETTTSYLSIIELGLYDSTLKIYKELTEQGIEPHSDQWKAEVECKLNRHKEAMHPRLFPEIPGSRYVCFYPMDRRRGEEKNWYTLPIEERARQMNEHGLVGRRYAGEVRQIITGSIGYDDWEWGVDLFADDPLVFKKLIYEMRFDEVSAVYALFGQFYVGVRVPGAQLEKLLAGELPG